jgi:glycosyltransferase involved in cell wall biosynthesis
MRVMINAAFLSGEAIGGGWTYTAQLVSHLTRRQGGNQYLIVVNERIADLLSVSDVSGEKVVARVNPESRLGRVAWENTVLPRLVRRYCPDVFHSPGNVLPAGVACRTVVTVHDLQYVHYPENFAGLRRAYLRWRVPASVRRATRVMCDSDSTRRDVMQQFHVGNKNLAVVHLGGLPDEELNGPWKAAEVRQRYNIDGPYLLSVGSSLPHKNLVRMVEAFASIAGKVEQRLVITGEGFSHREGIVTLLAQMPAEHRARVQLLGFLPRADLPGLYAGADAFIFPSLFEGFGIPAIEAMNCGCPVIASKATSLPEVVGDAGLLFDALDLRDMAAAMLRICSDGALREDLRNRGTKRSSEFTWSRTADATTRIYEEAAFL